VAVADVCQTLEIDLEQPTQCLERLRKLADRPYDELAAYVRLVVFGFAMVREKILKRILDLLPLLHEIMLPDRKREPSILVCLCDIVETCAKTNPGLHNVIFEDNTVESLW